MQDLDTMKEEAQKKVAMATVESRAKISLGLKSFRDLPQSANAVQPWRVIRGRVLNRNY